MIDQMNEQLQASMKPVAELATLNMKALQDLATQQNTLFTTLLNDGVEFVQSASGQKDVMGLMDMQKSYVEGLQSKVTSAAQDAYAVISETQKSAGVIFKGMGEEVSEKFASMSK